MTTPLPPSPLKEALLLPQALEASVRQFARLPALEYFGRRWSYRRLGQLVDAAAAGLQKVGVGPGVKVGLCLPNTPYSVILYYAVLKARYKAQIAVPKPVSGLNVAASAE